MAQDNRSFESTLHDVVYSIDTGTGLKIIRIMLYVLMMLVVLMLYTATQFRGMTSEEAMDYAQLGRNMSLTDGMTTKCVRPVSMWKVDQRSQNENPQIKSHPDLFHPPAYPALLSVGFKLFTLIGLDPFNIDLNSRVGTMPAEQWVILPVNHIFTLLTGWLVFSLGKRLFSREIGFLGMTIFLLSNLVWKDSISGLNLSMASFFIVASFHSMIIAMLNRRENEAKKRWIVPFLFSVVFAAIAFLTRYIAFAAVPGIVLFAWLMGGGFRGGTRFVVLFVVLYMMLISPWLYRNVKVSGNPMGMAGHTALVDTAKYPDQSFVRQLNPVFSAGQAISFLKEKWVLNYSEKNEAVLPGLGGGVLMALFITTFFYNFLRPQVNYLRWGLGGSILLTLVIAGFFSESSIMMIHAFWPFIILYGLAFFYILLDRLDLGTRLYITGLKAMIVVLASLPFALTLMPPHAKNPYPPYWPPIISRVSNMLTPREVLCTDMPWATAWYGDRVSILLPTDIEDFLVINDEKQYISGIYVTAITKNKPFAKDLLTGPEKSWLPIITGRPPPSFPLREAISLNSHSQDQIFISDHNRWAGSGKELEK